MKPTVAQLQYFQASMVASRRRFFEGMLEMWPVGTPVAFRIARTQIRLSHGTVTGACGDGRMAIQLDKPSRRGRRVVKHVPWQNIALE